MHTIRVLKVLLDALLRKKKQKKKTVAIAITVKLGYKELL